MVNHVKTFLASSLIIMKNLVAVSHSVFAHVEVLKLGDAGARSPLECGVSHAPHPKEGVADPKKHYVTMCYHTKFRCSRSQFGRL